MSSQDSSIHDTHTELVDFIAQMGGESQLRVEENLGSGFVRLRTSEAERRQAKHDIRHVEDILIELLRNARDAHASHIFVSIEKHDSLRTITILDDGDGVPHHLHGKIFDARVTSKLESMVMDHWGVHGRGMALFSIQHTTQRCNLIQSAPQKGSVFQVVCDTEKLPERADQSSWPVVSSSAEQDEDQTTLKGPKNLIRTIVEFCLELNDEITVYLGNPTEICTALYAHGKNHLDPQKMLFIDDVSTLSVPLQLGACADAREFIETAASLGLDISERTAHRILSQSMEPVSDVLEIFKRSLKRRDSHGEIDLFSDRRGLKISKEDLNAFSHDLEKVFEQLADKYYMSLSEVPIITVSKDRVRVTFKIDKEG